MLHRPLAPLLVLSSLILLTACRTDDAIDGTETLRLHTVTWAAGEHLPEGPWTTSEFWRIPAASQQVWIETTFELGARHRSAGRPLGLLVAALASCEARWDDHLLTGRGRPSAEAATEIPGPTSQVLHVPDRLANVGTHRLQLRCSNHHRGYPFSAGYWLLAVGDYGRLLQGERVESWTALVGLSGMLVLGIYYLLLYLLDRRQRPHLLLALLALSACGMLVAETWRNLVGYTYDWHIVRLGMVAAMAWCVAFFLLSFLSDQFVFRRNGWLRGLAVVAISLPLFTVPSWDGKLLLLLWVALGLAFGWCVLAWWHRRQGAALATFGVAGCLVILLLEPRQFVDRNLYLGLGLLLLLLLASHARHMRAGQRTAELALLRSARLELELLKRHLQPHFLMNSLTALSEWVEEEPATAVQMIEALADEMRHLVRLADRRSIALEDELALCHSHLAVMSLRRDCRYRLEVDLEEPDAEVPPAVFHTLVENAVTHGAAEVEMELRLSQHRRGDLLCYVLQAPMAPPAEGVARAAEGTGIRYIKARLTECFGEAWSLHGGAARVAEAWVWQTELQLPRAGAAS